MSEAEYVTGTVIHSKNLYSSEGDKMLLDVITDEQGVVSIDGREYHRGIYYMEEIGYKTPYVVNPVLFFDEDFLLDFKNLRIWFKQ